MITKNTALYFHTLSHTLSLEKLVVAVLLQTLVEKVTAISTGPVSVKFSW